MTDANLILGLDGSAAKTGAEAVKRNLQGVKAEARSTANEIVKVEGTFERLKKAAFSLAGAFSVAFVANKIKNYSDEFKQLEGRLGIVIDSTSEFNRVQGQLFKLAQDSRQSFSGLATLYTRIGLAAKNNAVVMGNLTAITEVFAKGLAITGETAQAAQGAITQFSQGIAGNFQAAGQELQSLIEQAPQVAQALADGLNEIGATTNATVGDLKRLAQEGILTGTTAARALAAQVDEVNAKFAKMPVTIGGALTQLSNAFLFLIGKDEEVKRGADALTLAISFLANNLRELADVAAVVGSLFAGRYVASLLASGAAFLAMSRDVMAVRVALGAMEGVVGSAATRIVLLSNATAAASAVLRFFGGPAGIVVAAATALFYFSDSAAEAEKASAQYTDALGNLSSIQGQLRGESNNLAQRMQQEASAHIDNAEAVIKETEAKIELLKVSLKLNTANALSVARTGQIPDQSGIESGIDRLEAKAKKLRGEVVKTRYELDAFISKGVYTEPVKPQGNNGFERVTRDIKGAAKEHKVLKQATLDTLDATEALGQQTSEVAQIYKDFATNVQRSFTDMFRQILDGGNGFKNFAKNLVGTFKDMLANMATMAIARPIIVPIINAVGGAIGLSGSDLSQVTGQLGGGGSGGGFGGIGDALSLAKGGFGNFLSGNIGGFNAINQFGAKYLGTGIVGQGAVTGASLSSVLSGAGIGGFAANMLGLGSGNGLVDTGLSMAGAYGGSALASLLGAGSFAGPAGILGAFALTALGGLFKKKPSSGLQSGSLDIGSGAFLGRGGLTGSKFNQKNYDTVSSLSQLVQGLGGVFGTTGEIQVAAGNRRGLEYAMTGDRSVFDADNPLRKSFQTANALVKSLADDFAMQAGENLSGSLKTAMQNINFGTTEEALKKGLEDLVFAAGFDKIGEMVAVVPQAKTVLDELNARFDEMAATAKRLGLEEAKVNAAREQAIGVLRGSVNKGVLDSIMGITDPKGLAISQEQARFAAQAREVEAVNGDMAAVYALHRMNMLKITYQYDQAEAQSRVATLQTEAQNAQKLVEQYSNLAKTLGEAARNMRLGDLSILSPEAKLEESRSQFTQLLQRAMLGDAEAQGQLPQMGQELLRLSQAFNSSNELFADDFRTVQNGLQQAQEVALRQVSIQQGIASAAQAQIDVLSRGFTSLEAALQALATQLGFGSTGTRDPFTGAATNAAGRSLTETLASGLTVGQHEAVIRNLTGWTGASGNGQLDAALKAQGISQATVVAAMRAAGAKGFAQGGVSTTQPFIVGENAPEVIASRSSALVIPFQQNAAMWREMQQTNRHLMAQNRLLSEGMQQLIAAQKATSSNTARIADETTIAKRAR